MSNMETARQIIDSRMQSAQVLQWAINIRSQWIEAPSITVFTEDKVLFEGNLNAITNPMLEAGFLHCRALLDFLGLREEQGALAQIQKRRPDDFGVENFSINNVPLAKVSPQDAIGKYSGSPSDAERALLKVLKLTNKVLAHNTEWLAMHRDDFDDIEIACEGVPALMTSYFYTPLGLTPPSCISMEQRLLHTE